MVRGEFGGPRCAQAVAAVGAGAAVATAAVAAVGPPGHVRPARGSDFYDLAAESRTAMVTSAL